jgi:DNA-binding transcriptional ArsR family regulator
MYWPNLRPFVEKQLVEPTTVLDVNFVKDVSKVIKCLGHPDRLRIVELLRSTPMKVKDIQAMVGLTQAVTSQHLRQMYHLGILRSTREGQNVIYSMGSPLVLRMLHCLEETQNMLKEDLR